MKIQANSKFNLGDKLYMVDNYLFCTIPQIRIIPVYIKELRFVKNGDSYYISYWAEDNEAITSCDFTESEIDIEDGTIFTKEKIAKSFYNKDKLLIKKIDLYKQVIKEYKESILKLKELLSKNKGDKR